MQTLAGNDGSKDYYLAYIEKYDKVIVWVNGKQKYLISIEKGGAICDCPGFTYHGHCKHNDFATAEFAFNKIVKPSTPIRVISEMYYSNFLEKEKQNESKNNSRK
jgi:hypothetical protein